MVILNITLEWKVQQAFFVAAVWWSLKCGLVSFSWWRGILHAKCLVFEAIYNRNWCFGCLPKKLRWPWSCDFAANPGCRWFCLHLSWTQRYRWTAKVLIIFFSQMLWYSDILHLLGHPAFENIIINSTCKILTENTTYCFRRLNRLSPLGQAKQIFSLSSPPAPIFGAVR
jgi:hypothetical protein